MSHIRCQDDGDNSDVAGADDDDDSDDENEDDVDEDSDDENEHAEASDDVADTGRESFANQETRDNYFHQQKSKVLLGHNTCIFGIGVMHKEALNAKSRSVFLPLWDQPIRTRLCK